MTHAVAIVPAKDRVDLVAATVSALLDTGEVGEVLVVDDGTHRDRSTSSGHERAHRSDVPKPTEEPC